LNYTVHEQELLAFVHCLKKWRHYLDAQPFTVYTDNRSLETLKTNTNLSKRQIRWLELFQSYQFDIHHIPRLQNVAADALSKKPYNITAPTTLRASTSSELTTMYLFHAGEELKDDIRKNYKHDEIFSKIWDDLQNNKNSNDHRHYRIDDENLLIYTEPNTEPNLNEDNTLKDGDHDRICVPRVTTLINRILKQEHDAKIAGHLGIDKTYERVRRTYYWPRMMRNIRKYIQTCDSCQRNKPSNQKPPGLLHPLEIPNERWESISMDFIVQLPKTKRNYDAITIFVDRLTKRVHFAASKTTDTATDVAHMFINEIFRQHGLPRSIVSDRDSKLL